MNHSVWHLYDGADTIAPKGDFTEPAACQPSQTKLW